LRAAAALIDVVPVLLISSLLLALVDPSHPLPWQQINHHLSAGEHALHIGMAFVAVLVYYPVIMARTNGQTLGKLAMGIRVIRVDNQPMTLARAAWREGVIKYAAFFVVGLIPVAGILIGIADDLQPIPDPQNRAIHDMLAATRVIKAHPQE
jgi:uncharacterized RDD family membrane protein YckC